MQPAEAASTVPEFFYDLLSILTPGLYFLMAAHFLYEPLLTQLLATPLVHPAVVVLVLAYLLGHLLYSLSSVTVARPFGWYFGKPAAFLLFDRGAEKHVARHRRLFPGTPSSATPLFDAVRSGLRRLGQAESAMPSLASIDTVYELCRNYVMETSARRAVAIRKEQAYGEMSRSIVLTSLLALIVLLSGHFLFDLHVKGFWAQVVTHLVFILGFGFRYGQARIISPFFIFATFGMMLSEGSPSRAEAKDS